MSSEFPQGGAKHSAPPLSGHHGHHRDSAHDEALADLLDLDAAVLGSWQDEVISWLEPFLPATPQRILDVGAGTGNGSLALARRFPTAQLTAIDRSPVMLQRLQRTVAAGGLEARVDTVQADLDEGWPQPQDVHLVWAASFLHEAADPDRVIRRIGAGLAPGGVLLVVEMETLPRFLPNDIGLGRPGLEERCIAKLTGIGWNSHPDWRAPLERGGLEVVGQRSFPSAAHPDRAAGARWAQAWLRRVREVLDGQLEADDLTTLDQLLAGNDPGSVLHRDLSIRAGRTAWAARRA
jgi:SAM-dependent methyltransferase